MASMSSVDGDAESLTGTATATSETENSFAECEVQIDSDDGVVDLGSNATVSPLWRYFEVVKENVLKGQKAPAKCTVISAQGKLCGHMCKRTGGNTSSMKSHLKSAHAGAYAEFVKASNTALKSFGSDNDRVRTAQDQPKQSRLKFMKVDKKTTEQCALAGAYLIASEALPYSLVDSDGFRKFIDVLRPGLAECFPGRRAMTENYVPRLYTETVESIKALLKDAEFVSLTADGWTSAAKESYIGATVHFITSQWDLISATLGCMSLDDSHTAQNVSEFFESLLKEWAIKKKSVSSATVDNAANFVAAIRELGITVLKCLAHSLQLAIDILYEHKKVKPVVLKVKQILSAITGSTVMRNDMFETGKAMNLKCVSLPLTCKTRWWTLLRTMNAVKRNLPALRIVLAKERRSGRRASNHAHIVLTTEEEGVLDVLLHILTPLEMLTEALSSESYVTGSAVVPLVSIIDTLIVQAEKQVVQRQTQEVENDEDEDMDDLPLPISAELTAELGKLIKNSLNDRYIDFSGHGVVATDGRKSYKHMTITSFVDPRFKDNYVADEEMKADLKERVTDECIRLSEPDEDDERARAPEHPPKKVKVLGGMAAVFSLVRGATTSQPKSDNEKAIEEIESYMKLPILDMDEDPLKWWKIHESSMPMLARVAKRFLCCQGSSVPTERVFSKGGLVVTDFRTCLAGEHVNQLVFLNMNKKFIKLMKH